MELSELCGELKNWFSNEVYLHAFVITNGSIDFKGGDKHISDVLQSGQYFRIVGSVFNDGVYQYPTNKLTNEEFEGAVWAMRVPKDVLNLKAEIDAWILKYGDSANSPFQSESFGGYSYSKGSLSSNEGTKDIGWSSIFRAKLNRWRKI